MFKHGMNISYWEEHGTTISVDVDFSALVNRAVGLGLDRLLVLDVSAIHQLKFLCFKLPMATFLIFFLCKNCISISERLSVSLCKPLYPFQVFLRE
uniref:Uncharacterized protein n=1 Tax=Oryza brachyantha TaxID=4533 RepID=J3LQ89_ORYBR